jgi:hypothetical protein
MPHHPSFAEARTTRGAASRSLLSAPKIGAYFTALVSGAGSSGGRAGVPSPLT